MRRIAFCSLFACAPFAACGTEVDSVIEIRIPEHPRIPSGLLMDGCRFWEKAGLSCRQVRYVRDQDVAVVFRDGPCQGTSGMWDPYIRAVWIWPDCAFDAAGRLDAANLKNAFAHEIGHGLGIRHVPASCDRERYELERDAIDSALELRTHPDGRLVCGPAVMNAAGHHGPIQSLTEMDLRAFDLRDRGQPIADFRQ